MSDNFEWHTEDDWDQFGQDDDSAELSSPNRKRWIITGIILLAVVLVGGYFLAQNMSQRVEDADIGQQGEVLGPNALDDHGNPPGLQILGDLGQCVGAGCIEHAQLRHPDDDPHHQTHRLRL